MSDPNHPDAMRRPKRKTGKRKPPEEVKIIAGITKGHKPRRRRTNRP